MQYADLVISTILAGSQKPSEIPGTGVGCTPLTHAQIGEVGFSISLLAGLLPAPVVMFPTEIGNIHDQQISVIGFTNLPLQVTLAFADMGIIIASNSMIICLCKFRSWSFVVVRQDFKLLTSLC
jgi:hypothetical protein